MGNETRLQDCPGRENPSCARGEVAGVVCGGQLDWVIPPTRAATVNLPRLSSPVIHLCRPGETCISREKCPRFLDLREQWRRTAMGSAGYDSLLQNIRGMICQKADK